MYSPTMLDLLVKSEEFFTSRQGSILMSTFHWDMGHLEVVVEHVVAPKEVVLNAPMAHAHISGANATSMSFKFLQGPEKAGKWGVVYAWGIEITTNNQAEPHALYFRT